MNPNNRMNAYELVRDPLFDKIKKNREYRI